ncbi:hypothetical protein V2J09_022048, partial [Rumex salicifolius]
RSPYAYAETSSPNAANGSGAATDGSTTPIAAIHNRSSIRNRRAPAWLSDYVTGGEGEEDQVQDTIAQFIQFPFTLYKQMVGSLMYVTPTRPDVMYSVCLISMYMAAPTELHQMAAKRILRCKVSFPWQPGERRSHSSEVVWNTSIGSRLSDETSQAGHMSRTQEEAWSSAIMQQVQEWV